MRRTANFSIPSSTRPRRRMPAASRALDDRVDRVARRAGRLAHDGALLFRERVEEARLADVRPPDDRDARVGGLYGLGRLGGQFLDDRVEEVAGPGPLQRGDGVQIAEAERIELGGLRLAAPRVGLVGDEHHGFAAAAQAVGDLVLDRDDAGLRVDDEEDHVGLVDGRLGLPAHGRLDLAGRIVEAAGVHEGELPPAPVRRGVEAIAGGPRLVLHDGHALADDTVEEGRFADVGTPDDGDQGPGHGSKPRRRSPPRAPSPRGGCPWGSSSRR